MNHADALDALVASLAGAQKARSNILEAFGDDLLAQKLLPGMNRFLFGDGSVVPPLHALIEKSRTAPIHGGDLFNFLTIATRFEPAIAMCALNYGVKPLPDPDISWFAETWAPESA